MNIGTVIFFGIGMQIIGIGLWIYMHYYAANEIELHVVYYTQLVYTVHV